jgi:hypothetical protein
MSAVVPHIADTSDQRSCSAERGTRIKRRFIDWDLYGRTLKCKILVLGRADPNSNWKRSFRREVGGRFLIDAGSRICARFDWVSKKLGHSRSSVFANGRRFSCKKEGVVYNLIAKL